MGKRGTKRTPTPILKLRGSRLANRNPNEPEPEQGEPALAEGLTPEAVQVWQQVVPMLMELNVLTKIDGPALGRYCQYLVRWRECEDHVRKYGMTYPLKNKKGDIVQFNEFPQVKRSQTLSAELRKLESEFGLTPASRSHIVVPEKKDSTEDKAKFFA